MAYVEDHSGQDHAAFSRPAGPSQASSSRTLPRLHLLISRAVARRHRPFPELDCVRNRLPPRIIAAAERRAADVGVSADRVLIASGIIDEDSYMMALARWLRIDFETFADRELTDCPLNRYQLIDGA